MKAVPYQFAVHSLQTQMVGRGIVVPMLRHTRHSRGWVVNPVSRGCCTLRKDTRSLLYCRLGGSRSRSGWVRKTSPTPVFEPWTVQRIVESLYRLRCPGRLYVFCIYVSLLEEWKVVCCLTVRVDDTVCYLRSLLLNEDNTVDTLVSSLIIGNKVMRGTCVL